MHCNDVAGLYTEIGFAAQKVQRPGVWDAELDVDKGQHWVSDDEQNEKALQAIRNDVRVGM